MSLLPPTPNPKHKLLQLPLVVALLPLRLLLDPVALHLLPHLLPAQVHHLLHRPQAQVRHLHPQDQVHHPPLRPLLIQAAL